MLMNEKSNSSRIHKVVKILQLTCLACSVQARNQTETMHLRHKITHFTRFFRQLLRQTEGSLNTVLKASDVFTGRHPVGQDAAKTWKYTLYSFCRQTQCHYSILKALNYTNCHASLVLFTDRQSDKQNCKTHFARFSADIQTDKRQLKHVIKRFARFSDKHSHRHVATMLYSRGQIITNHTLRPDFSRRHLDRRRYIKTLYLAFRSFFSGGQSDRHNVIKTLYQ